MVHLSFLIVFALLMAAGELNAQVTSGLEVPMTGSEFSTGAQFQNINGTQPLAQPQMATSHDFYQTSENDASSTRNRRRVLGDDDGENSDPDDNSSTDQPGSVLPVGNGLWAMLFAALAYCVGMRIRRREA